ncbi:uncharacterized protein LOC129587608 isoform X2 [Paramacrobiotus metropolitanus]|nr:uncharacterized protein LOC129587608 isoform X2 [Paramacrobiotus metropolitanus]
MPSIYDADIQRQVAEEQTRKDDLVLEHHEHAQGGQPKLTTHIDPKYSGYFPYQQHRFAQRNPVREREGALQILKEKDQTCVNHPNPFFCRNEMPIDLELKSPVPIKNPTMDDDYGAYLNNVRSLDDIGDFYVPEVEKALSKPYRLPPGHALKRFPYGYTGWLPFTTEFVGLTRGELSKVCLEENDRCRHDADVFRTSSARMPSIAKSFAPEADDDLNRIVHGIPGYTGYKEGTRYRYGYTHAREMKEVVMQRHPRLSRDRMSSITDTLYRPPPEFAQLQISAGT